MIDVNVELHSFLRDCLPPGAGRGQVVVSLSDPSRENLAGLIAELGLDRMLKVSAVGFTEQTACLVMLNGSAERNMLHPLYDQDRVEILPAVAGGGYCGSEAIRR